MASFSPETTHVIPFYTRSVQLEQIVPMEGEEYNFFIIYSCGDARGVTEVLIRSLRARYPNATIVGGICRLGFVSLNDRITWVGDGIFGIMASEMPCKSIMSLGVQSVLDIPYHVRVVRLNQSDESLFVYLEIRDHEGKVPTSGSLRLQHEYRPDYIGCGLRRRVSDGFDFSLVNILAFYFTNPIILRFPPDEESLEIAASLENAELDLFRLDGETCQQHMDWALQQLKEETRDERILGAVMFCSKRRGPGAGGIMCEPMSDATQFQQNFPTIPCCGFYAESEIGPCVCTGEERFFQAEKAAVTLRVGTAVFAVFIVPAVKPRSYDLDDSDENVVAFVNARLGRVAHHD
jgi:small ligand-binding sensory domain FIST